MFTHRRRKWLSMTGFCSAVNLGSREREIFQIIGEKERMELNRFYFCSILLFVKVMSHGRCRSLAAIKSNELSIACIQKVRYIYSVSPQAKTFNFHSIIFWHYFIFRFYFC